MKVSDIKYDRITIKEIDPNSDLEFILEFFGGELIEEREDGSQVWERRFFEEEEYEDEY